MGSWYSLVPITRHVPINRHAPEQVTLQLKDTVTKVYAIVGAKLFLSKVTIESAYKIEY